MSPGLQVRKDLPVREDCGYTCLRPGAASKSPFRYRPVTGSHLLGSAVCRVLGVVDEIRVVAVTKPKSTTDHMEELLRRLLVGVTTPVPVPAPVPDVPVVEKLLQRLVTETQIRQPVPVAASEPAGLESLLRSLLSGQIAPTPQHRQGSF